MEPHVYSSARLPQYMKLVVPIIEVVPRGLGDREGEIREAQAQTKETPTSNPLAK